MKTLEMLFGFFIWPPTPAQVFEWGVFVLAFVIGAAIGWVVYDELWRRYKKGREQ